MAPHLQLFEIHDSTCVPILALVEISTVDLKYQYAAELNQQLCHKKKKKRQCVRERANTLPSLPYKTMARTIMVSGENHEAVFSRSNKGMNQPPPETKLFVPKSYSVFLTVFLQTVSSVSRDLD